MKDKIYLEISLSTYHRRSSHFLRCAMPSMTWRNKLTNTALPERILKKAKKKLKSTVTIPGHLKIF